MSKFLAAALVAVFATTAPAFAQEMAADHAMSADHAMAANPAMASARLNLDTPIEVIVADEAGKAVLDADIPGLTTHEHYNTFKQMTLTQVANYAPDKLTAEVMAKAGADLAAIK